MLGSEAEDSRGRGWPRAVGLLGVVVSVPVLRPAVAIGIPFLLLLARRRRWNWAAIALAALASLWVTSGIPDGLWYAERGWVVLVAGAFVAASSLRPQWSFSATALSAVAVATAVVTAWFALRAGAWEAIDWAVRDAILAGLAASVDLLATLSEDRVTPAATVDALRRLGDLQAWLFPALVALSSMAALGVAHWASVRVTDGGDRALGPLAGYRFNDHLVWLLIAGAGLSLAPVAEGPRRLGANLALFMGALYAVRGAAVLSRVAGRPTALGWALLGAALALFWYVIVPTAALIGIADTWLDLRSRLGEANG